MEPNAIPVFSLTDETPPTPAGLKALDNEDRAVITTVANKLQEKHKDVIFSTKVLPSRTLVNFYNLNALSIEELRRINICNHRIKKLEIHFSSATLNLTLWKKEKPPRAKERKNVGTNETKNMKRAVTSFVEKQASTIRESDERVIRAVLRVLLRWTWGSAASNVVCHQDGDRYSFTAKNLRTVSFKQLQELVELGDYVQGVRVNIKEKCAAFYVERTTSYIQENRAKRRRT
jgi:hypothetical protein